MKALNIKQAKANLVISHICSYFSLTPQSLNKKFNKTNEIEYVWPRQILEYILFVTIKLPGKEIEFITGVDHTTTVHSKKTVLNEIRNNSQQGKEANHLIMLITQDILSKEEEMQIEYRLISELNNVIEAVQFVDSVILEYTKTKERYFQIIDKKTEVINQLILKINDKLP